MDQNLRILDIAPPVETECTTLGNALQLAESHGSIHLSPAAALIIKEYIDSPDDINVPLGKQTIRLEQTGPIVMQDTAPYRDNIERPAIGRCLPAKCGKCILNVIPLAAKPNGYTIQRELIDSASLNPEDAIVQLRRYL